METLELPSHWVTRTISLLDLACLPLIPWAQRVQTGPLEERSGKDTCWNGQISGNVHKGPNKATMNCQNWVVMVPKALDTTGPNEDVPVYVAKAGSGGFLIACPSRCVDGKLEPWDPGVSFYVTPHAQASAKRVLLLLVF